MLLLIVCEGSGKTFLMDLFYDDVKFRSKRRVHFNSFMLGGSCVSSSDDWEGD